MLMSPFDHNQNSYAVGVTWREKIFDFSISRRNINFKSIFLLYIVVTFIQEKNAFLVSQIIRRRKERMPLTI